MSEPKTLQPTGDLALREADAATRRYSAQLATQIELEAGAGHDYLAARGLAEADVAHTFRLGFVHDPLPEHRHYAGALVIPYLTYDRAVLTMRFRQLGPAKAKYLTLPGDTPRLFNAPTVYHQGPRRVHLTEGEMDAIVLDRCGLPAVGVAGANTWQPRWRRILQQYDVVYVWGDPDEAGATFARAMAQRMSTVRLVHLAEGDVSETYAQSGAEGIYAALEAVEE